ncbi:MAG TPA: hypothetical protein PLV92_09080 [Pirellulaceae bacterium]|nr:hypothetical protein [Pirellulaceae bacterium]
MLSTLNAGALVTAGGVVQAASVTVEVLRPFLVAGERIEVGTRIALPPQLAAEMVAANKARVAPPKSQSPDDAPRARRRKEESKE